MGKSPVNANDVQESSYLGNLSNCFGLANVCFYSFTYLVQTSWTKKNSGMKFLNCLHHTGEGHCLFFKWVDPVMPDHAREVILQLQNQLDQSTPSNANVSFTIDKVAAPESVVATELKIVEDKLACL